MACRMKSSITQVRIATIWLTMDGIGIAAAIFLP